MSRVTKEELDRQIARAEAAGMDGDSVEVDSIGLTKEHYDQYRGLVDHDFDLMARLDRHTWTRTSTMTAHNIGERIEQIYRGAPSKELVFMMPPKLFADLLKAVR